MSEFITTGEVQARPLNKKKQAIWWLVGPFLGLIAVMLLWSLTNLLFVYGVLGFGAGTTRVGNILNVVLGLAGILCVIGSLFGWIVAIIVGSKREPMQMTYDKRSGPGSTELVPEEVKGWNWGAAFLSPYWGTWNGVWWWLIALIPGVGWIWWIIMGIFGSEWAWKADYWPSVEAFNASQKKWKPWGIFFMVLMILSIAASIMLPVALVGMLSASGWRADQINSTQDLRYDPYVTSSTNDADVNAQFEAMLRDLE